MSYFSAMGQLQTQPWYEEFAQAVQAMRMSGDYDTFKSKINEISAKYPGSDQLLGDTAGRAIAGDQDKGGMLGVPMVDRFLGAHMPETTLAVMAAITGGALAGAGGVSAGAGAGYGGAGDFASSLAAAPSVSAGELGASGLGAAGATGAAAVGEGAVGGTGTGAVGASAGGGGVAAPAVAPGSGVGSLFGPSTTSATGGSMFDLGGGLGIDEFGNITGASDSLSTVGSGDFFNPMGGSGLSGSDLLNYGKGALSFLNSYKGILGPAAGALLGGLAGGSKPAGTTTTVQDIPDWLKPYVQGNLNAAGTARDSLLSGPNVTGAATPEYLKTINGDYLNPGSNPYLDATYQHAANLMGANVDSRFEASGRYGSGAHQGVLQEGLNNLGTSIYGGNYQAERARQEAAVTGAPAFATNAATAAYAPYTGYSSLFPNVRSTSAPYFNNPLAGILGGALAGKAITG